MQNSKPTLRWALYNANEQKIDMLIYSIMSFKYFLKDNYNFVVTAHNTKSPFLEPLKEIATVLPEKGYFATIRDTESGLAPFRKWAPFRTTTEPEIHLDYDVFCINYPTILDTFIKEPYHLMLQVRTEGNLNDRTGYGPFENQINPKIPPCCVGLVGTKKTLNFNEQEFIKYYWKCAKINTDNWFFEQGALIKTLENEILMPTTLLANEEHIRYSHPTLYPLQTNTTMLHLISSEKTNYQMFKIIKTQLLQNFVDNKYVQIQK